MDPVSIIYLLISSGLLTQLLKYLLSLAGSSPDGKYTPLIAALVGAINDAVVVSPDGTVSNAGESPIALLQSLLEGGAAGLGAVGGHQLLFAKNYIKKPDVTTNSLGVRGIFPYLLPVMLFASLSGCAAMKSDLEKKIDFRVTTDKGCQALGLLSSAMDEKRTELEPLGAEAARSYLALQSFVQLMGINCKAES